MKLALMTNMVLALALVPVVGCGDDDAAAVCEAGRQVTCACTGGAEGFQRCRADGSGFDDCECSAPMDGGGGGEDAGGGTDSGPTDSGPPDSGLACDDGTMHAISDPECTACSNCAVLAGGPCEADAMACAADMQCADFSDCINGCGGNETCNMGCETSFPTGASLFVAAQRCQLCDQCPNNCGAADLGACM